MPVVYKNDVDTGSVVHSFAMTDESVLVKGGAQLVNGSGNAFDHWTNDPQTYTRKLFVLDGLIGSGTSGRDAVRVAEGDLIVSVKALGSISGNENGIMHFTKAANSDLTVFNDGLISGRRAIDTNASYGGSLQDVTIRNSGDIIGTSTRAQGVDAAIKTLDAANLKITNELGGTIVGQNSMIAISVDNTVGRETNSYLLNHGTITGNVMGIDELVNSGTLNGDVHMTDDSNRVKNTGSINGTVYMGGGDDVYKPDETSGAVYLDLGTGNDLALGSTGNETIDGGVGNDIIWGGAGDDHLISGVGVNKLSGDDGNDYLNGAGNGLSTLLGGAGDDTILGGWGADWIVGHEGADSMDGSWGDDSIFGYDDDDWIMGDLGDDRIFAGLGNDTVNGGDGEDALAGEFGDDQMDGGFGHDTIYGNAGADSIYGGAGNDRIYGGTNNDTIQGAEGDDSISGDGGHDSIQGSTGHDRITGNTGNDIIDAGQDNDTVFGNEGDDLIIAGYGDDEIHGGDGDDTITGGGGCDTISGGAGADVFDFDNYLSASTSDSPGTAAWDGQDRIIDFEVGIDKIDLSAISFQDQGLTWVGYDDPLESMAISIPRVGMEERDGVTLVLVNSSPHDEYEMIFRVVGTGLTEADFIL